MSEKFLVNCGTVCYNKKMYRINAYSSKGESENEVIAYFRKISDTGYAILTMNLKNLEIIKQEGEYTTEEIEACKGYMKNKMGDYCEYELNTSSEIINKRKQEQLNFYNELKNYEYIDKNSNRNKLLNNFRFANDIFILNEYSNIIMDFNIKFGNNEININNVSEIEILDENCVVIPNKKRREKEFDIKDICLLNNCMIYIWEVQDFQAINSPKINLYKVHIIYNGQEKDIIENVISESSCPRLLNKSGIMKFEFKRKVNDVFEFVKYKKGMQEIIRRSTNRYFSDEVIDYLNKPINEENLI